MIGKMTKEIFSLSLICFVATYVYCLYISLCSLHTFTGHAETAHNRIASVVVGFKEVLLEEAEKKKDNRK